MLDTWGFRVYASQEIEPGWAWIHMQFYGHDRTDGDGVQQQYQSSIEIAVRAQTCNIKIRCKEPWGGWRGWRDI